MTPQKILIGQIIVVFAIIIAATWAATQWAAHMLGYQTAPGPAWFSVGATPAYDRWRLYEPVSYTHLTLPTILLV